MLDVWVSFLRHSLRHFPEGNLVPGIFQVLYLFYAVPVLGSISMQSRTGVSAMRGTRRKSIVALGLRKLNGPTSHVRAGRHEHVRMSTNVTLLFSSRYGTMHQLSLKKPKPTATGMITSKHFITTLRQRETVPGTRHTCLLRHTW